MTKYIHRHVEHRFHTTIRKLDSNDPRNVIDDAKKVIIPLDQSNNLSFHKNKRSPTKHNVKQKSYS